MGTNENYNINTLQLLHHSGNLGRSNRTMDSNSRKTTRTLRRQDTRPRKEAHSIGTENQNYKTKKQTKRVNYVSFSIHGYFRIINSFIE